MRLVKLSANVAMTIILCSMAVSAFAEIKKCLEEDGSISYSDRTCKNALMIGRLNIADITPAGITALRAYEVQHASRPLYRSLRRENTIDDTFVSRVMQTPRSVKPVRYLTDVETVSHARETLTLLDQSRAVIPARMITEIDP